MEWVLACARVLMAVAFVAIGGYSVQADVGRSGAATIGGVELAAPNAVSVASFGLGRLQATNPCGFNCAHPLSSNCVHLGGCGCCAPGILADHLPAHLPIATAGGAFAIADSAVTGTNPEAPQEPPQIAA